MSRLLLCLPLACTLLAHSQTPAKPKPRKPFPEIKGAPGAASGEVAAGPLREPMVVRRADCTLVLKGSIQREIPLAATGASSANAAKHISESFEFELPGVFEEEVDPKGPVRFRFTASDNLRTSTTAKGHMLLSDDVPGGGLAPISAEASELTNAAPFVFEARGRGQSLIPVGGQVLMKGTIRSQAPMSAPGSVGETLRPLLSLPLPSLKEVQGRPGTPVIQFQGLAPWAWANTPGAFTVSGRITYAGPTAAGKATGAVDITLRIGPRTK